MRKIFFLLMAAMMVASCSLMNEDHFSLPEPEFIRGISLQAPMKDPARFIRFIDDELAPRGVNVLILRINYDLEWRSHPELNDPWWMLHQTDARKIVQACRRNHIKLVPLINCLGHQSWQQWKGALLKEYPQFEEDPMGRDTLPDFYCRSYCPNSGVHEVLFDLLDEAVDVFESKDLHVGMDEVFIIGSDSCKNGCADVPHYKLFADEARRLHDHLASRGVRMWMWGDRLIDGRATGLGKWEASLNDTWQYRDSLPRDILICDWHYTRETTTPEMFAAEGFDVVSCSWRTPYIAKKQLLKMQHARTNEDPYSPHMKGVIHTVWCSTSDFLDAFEGKIVSDEVRDARQTFLTLSGSW